MSEQAKMSNDELTLEEIRAQRKHECALGYRLFAALRWGDLGDGHISARDPINTDCFWMLPYGAAYQDATPSNLILVSKDGSTIEGDGDANMAGYYIHHPILNSRPELVSAVHVHTGWGTPFSCEVRPIEPISQESCIFFEDHTIFDDDEVQIQSVAAGKRIATQLADNRAIILRNHGLLTAADSVAEAVGRFVLMERVAEVHMKVTNPKAISATAARFSKQDLIKNGAGRIAFASLLKRHL
jgi:ribulose-5-phosphate 4-epimerase/fuculose-1-phosphate aldolase